MESSIVIKVKYENTLRRFNARVVNEELDLNMDGLREKIVSLFKFDPDTQLNFTYNDEDNDVVALVDDEDLRDVVRQALNPLRITVSPSTRKSLNSSTHSNGSSTTSVSPPLQETIQNLNTNVSEILKALPEQLREPLLNLSSDLAKKASHGASNLDEITDSLSKIGLHYLNQLSVFPPTGETKKSVEAHKDSDGLKNLVVPTEVTSGPTFKTEKVLQKTKSPYKNVGVNIQGVSQVPGLNSSFEASGSGNTNTSLPVHPVLPNDSLASARKQAASLAKRTYETSGVQYFGACPFAGMPITNGTAIPHGAQSELPEKIYNYSHGIFHRGIICDGCDVHPITGPRFKSKVREDYDLCSVCFAEMGNETDFIRIDNPVHLPSRPSSRKGSISHHGRVHTWTIPRKFKSQSTLGFDSRFIVDVNIPDGTIMSPLTSFTKIWRMRNNGTTVWPQGTRLVWVGGVRMATSPSIELEISAAGIQVDQELDVAVDFVAPELHGRHISYWRMTLPTGQKFGQRVWVLIEVDAYLKESMREARPGFNLNLPPSSESVTTPEFDVPKSLPVTDQSLHESNMSNASAETIDGRIPETSVGQSVPEPNLSKAFVEAIEPASNVKLSKEQEATNFSKAPVETIEPAGNVQVSEEQEAKFPIDDTLLVGGVRYDAGQSSSVSYPIINVSKETDPTVSEPSDKAILPNDEVNANARTEEKILKELEEMGFKHSALNKEILEMNNYDLEQTIDDLCVDSEWDPILEELEEMGFYNRDINKRLLKKNDGSIKRVVMDLIAVEKEKF